MFNYVCFLLNQSTFDTSIAVNAYFHTIGYLIIIHAHKVIYSNYISDDHDIGRLTWDWYQKNTWYISPISCLTILSHFIVM